MTRKAKGRSRFCAWGFITPLFPVNIPFRDFKTGFKILEDEVFHLQQVAATIEGIEGVRYNFGQTGFTLVIDRRYTDSQAKELSMVYLEALLAHIDVLEEHRPPVTSPSDSDSYNQLAGAIAFSSEGSLYERN